MANGDCARNHCMAPGRQKRSAISTPLECFRGDNYYLFHCFSNVYYFSLSAHTRVWIIMRGIIRGQLGRSAFLPIDVGGAVSPLGIVITDRCRWCCISLPNGSIHAHAHTTITCSYYDSRAMPVSTLHPQLACAHAVETVLCNIN